MRRWFRLAGNGLLAAGLGCGFTAEGMGESGADASSSGSGATSSTVTGSTTTDAVTTSTADAGPSTTTTTAAATTDASDASSATTTSEGSTTATGDCSDDPLYAVLTADRALLAGGMMQGTYAGIGPYAYSESADLGIATFSFSVPCADTYYVWGLVWDDDRNPFADGGNADTFTVQVDLGAELTWPYGCQTLFQVDPWSYERVQVASAEDCSGEAPQSFPLAVGMHEVTLGNVEAGTFDGDTPGDVAAIARIFVTNDPDYLPDPDVD